MTAKLRDLIFKNTGYQLAGFAVTTGIGFAVTAVLSRYFGVEGFGQYNYVIAFFMFFMTLNDFGVNTIVVREVSKYREEAGEIIGSLLLFKLCLACVSILIAWAVIHGMKFPPDLRQALYVYSVMLLILTLQLPSVIFQVVLKMEYPSILNAANRMLQLILILLVVWRGGGVVAMIGAVVVSEALMLPVLLKYAFRYVRPVLRLDFSRWGQVLRSSIPVGAATLVGLLTNHANFLFLERLSDLHQVGMYSAVYRVTMIFFIFAPMVMNTVYPVMSRYAHEDPGKLRRLYRQCLGSMGCGAVLLGIVTMIFSPLIVRILFGNHFSGAETGLSVFIWAVVFLYFAISGGNLLISLGKEKVSLGIQAGAGLVNVVLNLLWIPKFGYLGAVWATVIAYFLIMLATLVSSEYFLKKGEIFS